MKTTIPVNHKKISTKIGRTCNYHPTIKSLDSSRKAKLRVFQNRRKQAIINISFNNFSLFGLNKPP